MPISFPYLFDELNVQRQMVLFFPTGGPLSFSFPPPLRRSKPLGSTAVFYPRLLADSSFSPPNPRAVVLQVDSLQKFPSFPRWKAPAMAKSILWERFSIKPRLFAAFSDAIDPRPKTFFCPFLQPLVPRMASFPDAGGREANFYGAPANPSMASFLLRVQSRV